MSEFATIARPYARAAFELAGESRTLAEWSQVLGVLAATLTDDRIGAFINNPEISRQQLADIILAGFTANVSEDQRRFIRLLIDTRRLTAATEIAELFEAYRADAEQSVQAEIVSARPLDEQQITNFQQALAQRTGKTVRISTRVDESLIGGALVRAGDRVIDGSLKNRLTSLSTALAH